MNHLSNKVAIVTGASSGIGKAVALALASRGVKIVAAALNQEQLENVVNQIRASGGHAEARVMNVADRAQGKAVADFARETFGSVDILVNNAGLMLFSYWQDITIDDWDKMIDVNIKGYLNLIAGVLPHMLDQKSGQILNMASVAGHRVDPGAGIYSATKFFVHAMTESMRKDLGVRHGIRASTISPGVIDTGWADKVTDPEGRKAAQDLNKIAIAPSDLANAVLYALDQPANVTINDVIVSPTRQNW